MKFDIDSLNLDENIMLEEIPNIDLYMDQVIQLFESKFENSKRTDEDKILTKTMINNYVKGNFLMAVKKKKYTKEHIILMALIYELKGILSIADIKEILENISLKIEDESLNFNIEESYEKYLELTNLNLNDFKNEVEVIEDRVNQKSEIDLERDLLKSVILINKANMYRKLAQNLIDKNKIIE